MQENCPTQFTGQKTYKLDPKGRVAFPSNWKTGSNAIFKLVRAQREGFCVYKSYTEKSFANMILDIRAKAEAAGHSNLEIEQYIGNIIGTCVDAELSNQGKFSVGKDHREQLELEEQLMLVGRGTYFELWKPESYQAVYDPAKLQKLELDKLFGIFS